MSTAGPSCPHCKNAIPSGARACPMCLLAVRIENGTVVPVFPEIRPGASLYSGDLRAAPLIGMDFAKLQSTGVMRFHLDPRGLAVDLAPHKSLEWTNPYMRLRDACIRVRLHAFSGSGRLMLIARCAQIKSVTSQYAFAVSLERREAALVRMIGAGLGTPSTFTHLTPWTRHPALDRPKAPSTFELRTQGPTLEGCVDGVRVAVVHDPVLGIGRCGLRAENEGETASMVLAGVDIAPVVA